MCVCVCMYKEDKEHIYILCSSVYILLCVIIYIYQQTSYDRTANNQTINWCI